MLPTTKTPPKSTLTDLTVTEQVMVPVWPSPSVTVT